MNVSNRRPVLTRRQTQFTHLVKGRQIKSKSSLTLKCQDKKNHNHPRILRRKRERNITIIIFFIKTSNDRKILENEPWSCD